MDGCSNLYEVFPDAIGFANEVARLDNVVLGVRWVTCKNYDVATGSYKKENTDAMLKILLDAGVDKKGLDINILVRGHYANRSRDSLMELYKKLDETNPVTISFYQDDEYKPTGEIFPLNAAELRDAIFFFGPENTFIQVSHDMRNELNLIKLPNSRPATSVVTPGKPSETSRMLAKIKKILLYVIYAIVISLVIFAAIFILYKHGRTV